MLKKDFAILGLLLLLYGFLLFCSQSPYINLVRFLLVALCCIPALRYGVCSATVCTVISDFLLLFTPYLRLGVLCFCLVQLLYIAQLTRSRAYYAVLFLIPALRLPLPILAAVYALLFCLHIWLALQKTMFSPVRHAAYLFGLAFFVCCDLYVAYGFLTETNAFMIWLFYAPAQILLAFTARGWQPLPAPYATGQ